MTASQGDSGRPVCRLDPRVLHDIAAPEAGDVRLGKLFADLRRTESPAVRPRASFWDAIADYNPLGQFGARGSW